MSTPLSPERSASLKAYQSQLEALEVLNQKPYSERRARETAHSQEMPYQYPNGLAVPPTSIIAQTFTSLLLHHADKTLRIPLLENLARYDESSREMQTARASNEANIRLLEREKVVYLRLDGVEGVARCLPGSPGDGILLERFPHGTLEARMVGAEPLGGESKRRWVTEIISVLIRVHRAGVLARADITLANFAIGNDGLGSVVMVGFGCSVMAFPGVDVGVTVDGRGRSGVMMDVFRLGCVVYLIASWGRRPRLGRFDDLGADAGWHAPAIQELPSEEISVFGELILRCWGGGFESMQEVGAAWLEICSDLAGGTKAGDQGGEKSGQGSTATQGLPPVDENAYDNID